MNMNNKKVLLIAPPRTISRKYLALSRVACVPPLGLMYIAAELEARGYQVSIIDCVAGHVGEGHEVSPGFFRFGMPAQDILDRIGGFAPDYIGISSLFTVGHRDLVSLCNLIRNDFQVPLVAGGAHATAEWRRILEEGIVDYVVLGEGEYAFPELLSALEDGRDVREVAGVAHLRNGEPASTPARYIHDLDKLDFPAYRLIDFSSYMSPGHSHGDVSLNARWASLVTSRGCPNKCSFCFGPLMTGNKLRLRSVENVMEEIEFLKDTYQVDEILIEDDNFAHNSKRAIAILDAATAIGVRLIFVNGLAIYSLNNDDIVEALKRHRIVSVTVAIESGDQRILRDVMKKPVTPRLAKRVVHNLKRNGINVKSFFIVGMPGETVDSLRNTFVLIQALKLDWNGINVATPLPGTALAKTCVENNFVHDDFRSKLERIGLGESIIDTPYLNHKQVNKYAYYFNIFTNFIDIHEFADLKQWEHYARYKGATYRRVIGTVPGHKYAPISAVRIGISELILTLTRQEDDYASEIDSLRTVDGMLRQKQNELLVDELSQMEGEIVLFESTYQMP